MNIEQEGLLESSESFDGTYYHSPEVPRSSLCGNFVTAVKCVWADTKKNTKSFVIGCVTVAIVVFSLRCASSVLSTWCWPNSDHSLLQNSIEHAPIIFLKLGEDNVGEYDLVILPDPQANQQRR